MALRTKDYTVTGKSKSGIYYTFKLRVMENSVDVLTNSSSITVEAILVSDYEGLAFFNVGICIEGFINAQQVIDSAQWQRCEGTGEQIYATWTGDVAHDADGTLSLTVSGKLWTTGTANFLPPVLTIAENADDAMVLTPIVANTAPDAPTELQVPQTVVGGGDVPVSWNASADPEGDALVYELERSTDGEVFEQIYRGADLQWTDAAPLSGSIQYRVRAEDPGGLKSEWSEQYTVCINTPPQLGQEAAFRVFSDEAHMQPISNFAGGQTIYLQIGPWEDVDDNLTGGQLVIQQRTKTPAGAVGDWEDLQILADVREATVIHAMIPEGLSDLGSLQLRAAAIDTMGAQSLLWLETEWILRKDIPQVILQNRWHRPTMEGVYVMPYVWKNGKWVRYGGMYQEQSTDNAVAVLSIGVLGAMILGKEW